MTEFMVVVNGTGFRSLLSIQVDMFMAPMMFSKAKLENKSKSQSKKQQSFYL